MRIALAVALLLPLAAATARARDDKIVTVRFEPPADVPVLGPRFAPVTIELFCDLTDPNVARIHEQLTRLRARHPRRLRVIYRLVARGRSRARSHDYVEGGREAFVQGRFEPFLDAYLEPRRRGGRGREHLVEAAEKAGLDVERFKRALADDRHAEAIMRNHYYQRRYRVRSVPGFLFNGVPRSARDLLDLDSLEAAYDKAYARGRELLDEGVPLSRLYDRLLREAVASQPSPEIGVGSVDGLARGEKPPRGPPPLLGGAVDTSGPHSRGPEDAKVVLVFFCSFQSRNCMSMSRIVEDLRAAYPKELRVVFKHLFDDDNPNQKSARRLHEASLCAEEQGAFWDFYDRIYSRHQRREVSDDDLIAQLSSIETLDTDRLARCLDEGRYAETVQDYLVSAHRLGVTLTPSFVIGGRLYIGTKSFDDLRALVDQELSPGLLERLVPAADADDIAR